MDIKCQNRTNHIIALAVKKIIDNLGIDSSKIEDIEIHIILDPSIYLNKFNNLLKNWKSLEKTRFIFIKNFSPKYRQREIFWEELLVNIGVAKSIRIKEEGNLLFHVIEAIYDVSSKISQDFNHNLIGVLFKIIRSLQNEIYKEKEANIKNISIDMLDDPESIIHHIKKEEKADVAVKLLSYAYLKHAIFDWVKNNKWVLDPRENANFRFLILDDLISEESWPSRYREKKLKNDLLRLEKLLSNKVKEWQFFRLTRPKNENFLEHIFKIVRNKDIKILCHPISGKKERIKSVKDLILNMGFTHVLIDWNLGKSTDYSGFNLLRDLSKIFVNSGNLKNIIPEFFILSRNDDPVTVQSALNAGASGYIVKDRVFELPFIIGRAGKPLRQSQINEIRELLANNFPCLLRFPRFVQKSLYFEKINRLDSKKAISSQSDNKWIPWIDSIPKADLHTHFGVSIPLETCYDLAAISIFRWYSSNPDDNSIDDQIRMAANSIINIYNKAKELADKKVFSKNDKKEISFRIYIIEAAQEVLRTLEIAIPNDIIKVLNKKYSKLSEEKIACLLVVSLGFVKRRNWKESLLRSIQTLLEFTDSYFPIYERSKSVDSDILSKGVDLYGKNCRPIVKSIQKFYTKLNIENEILAKIDELFNGKINLRSSRDPLSLLISISERIQPEPQGLIKYLGGSDYLGASLLQFAETVILASITIPKWASEGNVWHLELRVDPLGFMKEFVNPNRGEIISKMILLGMAYSAWHVQESRKNKGEDLAITASLLLTAKRHKKKETIKELLVLASDMVDLLRRDENEGCKNDYVIPRIAGIDLAGLERGYSPRDLQEYFHEAFKKCLLLTAHAGEDESVSSIYGSIYELHAARIGHGLKLLDDRKLMNLMRDRNVMVELCPRSNQFTNGFIRKSKDYVLKEFIENNIPVSINTDDPLLSHILEEGDKYPLSREFAILPYMVDIEINKLNILKLIWNGFLYSFLPPKCKRLLMAKADFKTFNILAKEYLDIPIAAERYFLE